MNNTIEELFGTDSSWDELVCEDEIQQGRLVQLQLPRFEVTYGIKSLADTFKDIGMGAVFDASADFQRMASTGAYIGDVLHKAVMKVDEKGTVAAAVTAVCTTKGCSQPRVPVPIKVKVDRPFLFLVYDKPKNIVLFVAKVETVSPAVPTPSDTAPLASASEKKRGREIDEI